MFYNMMLSLKTKKSTPNNYYHHAEFYNKTIQMAVMFEIILPLE